MAVVQTRVEHLQLSVVGGLKGCDWKQFVFPAVVQQCFHLYITATVTLSLFYCNSVSIFIGDKGNFFISFRQTPNSKETKNFRKPQVDDMSVLFFCKQFTKKMYICRHEKDNNILNSHVGSHCCYGTIRERVYESSL